MVPPTRYLGGWFSFLMSLVFIGIVTTTIGEFATLFGCEIGLKDSVTANSFVAIGTSLPETFASYTAAIQSKHADAAIGNITGSNSVNVFLGLGLPWTIATIYYAIKGETDVVPGGSLPYSVLLYLIVSIICLSTLIIRRYTVKGELGGSPVVKWITFFFFFFLWLIFLIFSTLNAYGILGF